MLKVENIQTFGFEGAMRGMRNPLNSWKKGDTIEQKVGPNDLDLAKRLTKSGTDHRKVLRMMHIQMDIIAPLYWWKEFDTYKIGTTSNSCSTMHKIHAKKFTLDDFSHEHLYHLAEARLRDVIDDLNMYRSFCLESKNKEDWWQMIQLLPSSYNQLRTIDMNYETALRMYKSRHNHKLDEWHTLCDVIAALPYMKEFLEADA